MYASTVEKLIGFWNIEDNVSETSPHVKNKTKEDSIKSYWTVEHR